MPDTYPFRVTLRPAGGERVVYVTAVDEREAYAAARRAHGHYTVTHVELATSRRVDPPLVCDWTLTTGLPCGEGARLVLTVDGIAHGACARHAGEYTLWTVDNLPETSTLTAVRVGNIACEYTDDGADPTPANPACGRPATVRNPRSGVDFDYDEWVCARHADPAWTTP